MSDTQPLIFIDHVAYGSPLEPQKIDSYCEGHYAPSIDKVGRLELVSKELNHLAAILHVYAGGLNFMK